jgi:CRISPR-associated protein Cas1
MRRLLNTLYVTTEDSYLSLDGENVVVLCGDEILGRIPLHNLEGIVYFGHKGASPALMGKCVELGIGLSFLSPWGKFRAKISGPTQGNVILRRTQVLWAEDPEHALCLGPV